MFPFKQSSRFLSLYSNLDSSQASYVSFVTLWIAHWVESFPCVLPRRLPNFMTPRHSQKFTFFSHLSQRKCMCNQLGGIVRSSTHRQLKFLHYHDQWNLVWWMVQLEPRRGFKTYLTSGISLSQRIDKRHASISSAVKVLRAILFRDRLVPPRQLFQHRVDDIPASLSQYLWLCVRETPFRDFPRERWNNFTSRVSFQHRQTRNSAAAASLWDRRKVLLSNPSKMLLKLNDRIENAIKRQDKSLGQISFKRIAQLSHEIDRQRVSSAWPGKHFTIGRKN